VTYTAVKYAIRAIRDEIFRFRFDYPLETVPEAGPRDSLHYYLYSESLSWDIMKLDPHGVPRARTRLIGEFYRPALIAWWGLVNLGHYLRHHDEPSLERFLIQLDWLERKAVTRTDGGVVWPNNFDCLQGSTLFTVPWVSAVDHGFILSAVVRGFRMTRRESLFKLLRNSSRVFELGVQEGGVRVPVERGVLYTELPGGPEPGILDGFITSLLGLYDLAIETGDPKVSQLFNDGIQGLAWQLPYWNYADKWSWYGSRAYLCPPSYHNLNRLLLGTLGRLSGEISLTQLAEHWDPQRLSSLGRAEIYVGFLITKNACRIRHRTWRHSSKEVQSAAARKRQQSYDPAV
jgi:hypothetical protein